MRLSYDRGTLVLHPPPGRPPLQRLRTMRWDPRVDAWRAPAFVHGEVRAELLERGVDLQDEAAAASTLATEGIGLAEPPLADHQAAALASWEAAGRRGLLVLPTGAGKTRIAIAAAARLKRPTLVLVPTRALLAQWTEELARWMKERACRDTPPDTPTGTPPDAPPLHTPRIGRLGDGWRELRPLTVATYESAARRAEELGDRFAFLVADEAHHAVAGRWADALRCSLAAARLGLTATPPEAGPAAARLESLLGPVTCAVSVAELTPQHLAPLERVVLEVCLPVHELRLVSALWARWSRAVRAAGERVPAGSWREVMGALNADPEGRRALRARAEAERLVAGADAKIALTRSLLRRHVDDRVLIFTSDNDAAYALSTELLIPAVTTDVRGRERAALLADFGAGRLRALVSSAVLNEGVDVPEARVAIVLGGRQGRREHVQRIGRVLRPRPGKTALLYELVARGTFEDPRRRRRDLPVAGAEIQRAARQTP